MSNQCGVCAISENKALVISYELSIPALTTPNLSAPFIYSSVPGGGVRPGPSLLAPAPSCGLKGPQLRHLAAGEGYTTSGGGVAHMRLRPRPCDVNNVWPPAARRSTKGLLHTVAAFSTRTIPTVHATNSQCGSILRSIVMIS